MPANPIAVPRLSMLDRQQCEVIHHASLEILRRTGVRVHHAGALALLRRSDADISDGNLVRFPAALVEWALAQAPSRVTCAAAAPASRQPFSKGTTSTFGPVPTAPITSTLARACAGRSPCPM